MVEPAWGVCVYKSIHDLAMTYGGITGTLYLSLDFVSPVLLNHPRVKNTRLLFGLV